jgi:AcrR family transcriptional regulator
MLENQNNIEDSEQNRIIEFAENKFMAEGFYKISMDSLASELRISKKTIYKYFPSKESLVESIANRIMTEISNKMESIINSDLSSLGKSLALFETFGKVTLRLTDKWVHDVQLHTPKLWEKIDEFRTQHAIRILTNIVNQGKKEGVFIDKPSELMIMIFVSSIKSIVNPNYIYYQQFNFKEAFHHTFEILFNGMLTPKGKKEFNKIFKKVIK